MRRINKLNYGYILLLTVLSYGLNAQQLVEIGNQWNIVVYPVFSPNTVSYSVRIGEDTTLNNIPYNKILYSYDALNASLEFQECYLRQDSTKKVFYKEGDTDEILLYDFSLEINDVFQVDGFCTQIVDAVDSVILNNGEVRKRWKLSVLDLPGWGEEYWIEGIGSDYGVISRLLFCFFDYTDRFLCFYSNSDLLYPDSPSSCFITPLKEIEQGNIKIYPNPIQDVLFIEDHESIFDEYIIYDATGKIILNGTLRNGQIHLREIKRGFYFLLLKNKEGALYSQKLIKE
jgi:hypothetical protein